MPRNPHGAEFEDGKLMPDNGMGATLDAAAPDVAESCMLAVSSPRVGLSRFRRRLLWRCIGTLSPRDEGGLRARAVAFVLAFVLVAGAMPTPASAATLLSDVVDGSSAAQRKLMLQALPDVTMKEGALVDGEGRVLWARTPDTRRPMASLTKIMTAVVALEHSSLSDVVTVPREAVTVGQSSAGLWAGEKLTMFELLEALLVKSGNDAAVTIAAHVGGSQPGFVAMMNRKASDLGLANTHYANPHGLDASGHYTTADDLAVLARYAMTKPAFRDIVRRSSVTIGTGKHRTKLQTTDELLGIYAGAMGVKTGNTNGAGYSVVSAAQRGGVTLFAVVMGTKSDRERFTDAKALLDWGFGHYRPMQIADKGTVIAEATVSDYLDVTVPLAFSQDTTLAVLDVAGPIKRAVSVAPVRAPVNAGQTAGVATFRQGQRVIATIPLVAVHRVGAPNPFEATWIAVVRVWKRVFG